MYELDVVSQLGSDFESRVAQVAGVRSVATVVARMVSQASFCCEAFAALTTLVLLLVCKNIRNMPVLNFSCSVQTKEFKLKQKQSHHANLWAYNK